jgi:hypothetical protein
VTTQHRGDEEAAVDRGHPAAVAVRGETTKIPMTAVIPPISGTLSGKTRPSWPNALLPKS